MPKIDFNLLKKSFEAFKERNKFFFDGLPFLILVPTFAYGLSFFTRERYQDKNRLFKMTIDELEDELGIDASQLKPDAQIESTILKQQLEKRKETKRSYQNIPGPGKLQQAIQKRLE